MAKAARTPVIEVDAEEVVDAPVSEMVQKTIATELKRFDSFESRLNELKEQYSGLTIVDVDDKEGYEAVRLAIGELRKIRTGTEKDKKAIKKPFLDACASFEAKSKWIIEEVSKIETPLQEKKDSIDAEKEKIKIEKKKKQDEAFILRQAELTKFGATYMDGSFVLEDVSYESVLLREADEDIYVVMRDQYKAIFDRKEAARIEAERLAAEEQAHRDAERAELDRLRREQEERAAQLKAESDRLERLKKEQEEAEKAEQERQGQEKKRQELQKFQHRLSQLEGYNYNGFTVSFEGNIVGSMEDLVQIPNDEFDTKVSAHKALLAEREVQRKAAEEALAKETEKRQKRISKLYELGLKFDADSINDQDGGYYTGFQVCIHSLDITGYDDAKWDETITKTEAHIKAFKQREEEERQAKVKADQEAAVARAMQELKEKEDALKADAERIRLEKEAELEAASDKTKYELLLIYLEAAPWNTFKSPQYKGKSKAIKTAIDKAK